MKSKAETPENMTYAQASAERYALAQPVLNKLKQYRKQLTAHQFKTLKGQAVSGDPAGAEKGLWKIVLHGL